MTLEEIHALLTEKFGDGVEPFAAPENGDAWIEVRADRWREIARALLDEKELSFDLLRCISGVDYVDWMESVYHLLSLKHEHEVVIKVKADRAKPEVPSVADVWPAAEWHECESYDMVGIVYAGHPDLRRILLPEDWEGFPLRKDYKQPDEYHGISHW